MRPRINSCSSTASYDSLPSSSTSDSDYDDEDELNARLTPYWPKYRDLIERRGFHLDTFRDVKEFYERYWEGRRLAGFDVLKHGEGYRRACKGSHDDDLCRDAGLPENLFRGTRVRDGKKIVVKAVRLRSREFDVIRTLSMPPLRDHPMNQTIPVLDLIDVPQDDIGLIIQEEWSPQAISAPPCSLRGLLRALRQCIEGLVFMHAHNIAHLDISLRNVLTDDYGRYKYIDFEMSRRFDGVRCPRIRGCRGTEIPPDIERGEDADPFKIDVWALGVLILRACQTSAYDVPELVALTEPMLQDSSDARPTARAVLQAFDRMASRIGESRLQISNCLCS